MSQEPAGARVLVLNCGSSSLKYRLFDGAAGGGAGGRSAVGRDGSGDGAAGGRPDGVGRVIAGGVVERIGEPAGGPADHETALRQVLAELRPDDLACVGHRVVHGGVRFTEPIVVDDEILADIGELVPLAPLHNPANLTGIAVARALLPGVPQVAVFDTAFHRTLPAASAVYAIDTTIAARYGIRRYGFHGTSHAYVSRRTAELIGRPYDEVNTISLHLGNGASACAVRAGRSVATSMGMSPLEGLVMGSRSGDVDPAVVFHLHRVAGMSLDEIDRLLNQRSGLFGLSGARDMREVLSRQAAGDPAAALAVEVYCQRLKSYVGSYYALLGRVDAISFTAGVGEHAAVIRAAALDGLAAMGVSIDADRNAGRGDRLISPPGAPVAVCVIATDEEREIARQALVAVRSA